MKIRNGNYTVHEGINVTLFEVRDEAPIPFTHFALHCEEHRNICVSLGFKKNKFGEFRKIVPKESIKQAYKVSTKASYKNEIFTVLGINDDKKKVRLFTSNKKLGKKMNFLGSSNRFFQEVSIMDIEEIWEERNTTEYDLPMPLGVERQKFINLRDV